MIEKRIRSQATPVIGIAFIEGVGIVVERGIILHPYTDINFLYFFDD